MPLDLPVQPRRPRLDVGVFHAQVCDVPVKERLELVAAVGSDGAYPEEEDDSLLSMKFSLIVGHSDPHCHLVA